jgi:hypothetical protein
MYTRSQPSTSHCFEQTGAASAPAAFCPFIKGHFYKHQALISNIIQKKNEGPEKTTKGDE